MEQKRVNTTILIKRRTSGTPGPPTSLKSGELAVNEVDNTLYIGTTTNSLSGTNQDLGFF